MSMASTWDKVRGLFRASRDALSHQVNMTARPGILVSQLFIIKFFQSFGWIFSFLIFCFLILKIYVYEYLSPQATQTYYALGIWVVFFSLGRTLCNRIRLGWMISVDDYFRLGRHQPTKLAISQGKKFKPFWKAARMAANGSPRAMNRELVRTVEFYRLLMGLEQVDPSKWYQEQIQQDFVEMQKRIRGRLNLMFYTAVIFLQLYVITTFFPQLGVFRQGFTDLMNANAFNATNMLAISLCCAAIYALFFVRQTSVQTVNIQTYCLRIAQNDLGGANQCRQNILELERDTRYSLGGSLRGSLAMDVHLLIFPAIAGLVFYFLTDFFAQIFVILFLLQLPQICRNIVSSRLFVTIQIMAREKQNSFKGLMKLNFLMLELIFLTYTFLFFMPHLTFIPRVGDYLLPVFMTGIPHGLAMLIFIIATSLLLWSKTALISQRESYQYSFLLMLFTAALTFMILNGYFVSFIYSLPALGLVCWRLSNKMRRGG